MQQNLGYGLGLRAPHYDTFLTDRPRDVEWLEIISDNFIHAHAGYGHMLDDLRRDYPIIMHGVSLSIGTTAPVNEDYVRALKTLADRLEVAWLSDHLCYTCMGDEHSHDLLPIPYTQEALEHLIPRIHKVQDMLQRPVIFENASSYLEFDGGTIAEPEFLHALHQATGCGILLDINNIYVSAFNHDWDAHAYIDAIPAHAVLQYHLAGHTDHGSYRLDTHNAPVIDDVWALYAYALKRIGARSTMVEWDADIPKLSVLQAELERARMLASQVAI